jgi:hypothetical protein
MFPKLTAEIYQTIGQTGSGPQGARNAEDEERKLDANRHGYSARHQLP